MAGWRRGISPKQGVEIDHARGTITVYINCGGGLILRIPVGRPGDTTAWA